MTAVNGNRQSSGEIYINNSKTETLHLALNFGLLKTHSKQVSTFTVAINVALSYDFYKRLIEIICLSVFLSTEQKAADDCTGTV